MVKRVSPRDPPDHHAVVKSGEENLNIYGYRTTAFRTFLFWFFSISTLGIYRLVLHWKKPWLVSTTSVKCSLEDATNILVIDDHKVNINRKVINRYSTGELSLVIPNADGDMLSVKHIRLFTFRKLDYMWLEQERKFVPLTNITDHVPFSLFNKILDAGGLTVKDVKQRLRIFGRNMIDVTLKPLFVLLCREAITPFYIFQVFSVIIWYLDDYRIFATIIVFMSVCSVSVDVYQIRKQEKKLRAMVHSVDNVQVIREKQIMEISSDLLVPGDILVIPPQGCLLHCDSVLMTGTVIVNESILTGESVPVTKVAVPDHDPEEDPNHISERFDDKKYSKHVLYCGTKVLQTRYYAGKNVKFEPTGIRVVKAVVIKTGYSTMKGQLVRSIMYPKPVDFRFTKDLFKFISFLAGIAAFGFVYSLVLMGYRGAPLKRMILRAFDIITIVVPPALPAAMSVGVITAQMRLRKKEKIFCISPSTINTCGAINVVCFDKTGTLTEDGLDFQVMRVAGVKEDGERYFAEETESMDMDELPMEGDIVQAVAVCHSLTRIEGKLVGDPLDLTLFNGTKWTFHEPCDAEIAESRAAESETFDVVQPAFLRPPSGDISKELAVVRQFTFSSSLQRMSVLVSSPHDETGRKVTLYCKGSPEMVLSLSDPATVPSDYLDIVNHYAHHGYRLIAVGRRQLDMSYTKVQKVKREQVECSLELLGIIVMENRVKPVTPAVIQQLKNANIRTVMVTGDNVLTALSVARECAIISEDRTAYLIDHKPDELDENGLTILTIKHSVALSDQEIGDHSIVLTDQKLKAILASGGHLSIAGNTYAIIARERSEWIPDIARSCDVYARMAPDQKATLVNHIQELDNTVAFCGDGANDCGALKAAHAGISLSDAEASIAAPFTSKIPDIRCVPTVIREGRAALVTSFGVFKYMAGYSLTQFSTILLLYWIATNLTDFMFLYIDMFLITLVAVFYGSTEAAETLAVEPPPTRLLSFASVASVLGQLAIVACGQIYAMISVTMQPWFVPFIPPIGHDVEDKRSMQGTAVFCISIFQYITLVAVYSVGAPYRKNIFSNKKLCGVLVLVTMVSLFVLLWPPQSWMKFMEFVELKEFSYRLSLLIVAGIGAATSFLFDRCVVARLQKPNIKDENSLTFWQWASGVCSRISLNYQSVFDQMMASQLFGYSNFERSRTFEDLSSSAPPTARSNNRGSPDVENGIVMRNTSFRNTIGEERQEMLTAEA